MTVQEIEAQLIKGIASLTNRGPAEIRSDSPITELGIDSLGFVEILVLIEKNFNLQLITSDLTKKDFETIRSLAAFISRSV